MAFFIFIDESGHDHHDSPYEVLVWIAIDDKDLWNFIRSAHELEINCFGRKYREIDNEIKLELCHHFRCKVFTSIICDENSIPADKAMLRKDYVYLFERFYYFLEDRPGEPRGIVVFDELDKSASHLLLDQMDKYFKKTAKGRYRGGLIIPEPFFVHSDLTTGIQVVDFVAYILSWNFRVGKLTKEPREELNGYLELVKLMRYRTTREIGDITEYVIWSIAVV